MKNRALAAGLVLLILSLAAGVGIGLLVGWILWPVETKGASVADLAPQYKDEYISLVGAAYAHDGALDKAKSRLDQLQVPNPAQRVADLADMYIHEGRDPQDVECVVELANGLGVVDPGMLAYVATATPVPTVTPSPTDTPLPTPTYTPLPPTDTPLPPTATEPPPPPTNTQPPAATAKPKPTAAPTKKATSVPKPPAPTATKKPPQAGVDFKVREARLFTYDEGGCCGNGLIQIKVLDADGTPLDNIQVHMVFSTQNGAPDAPLTGAKGPGVTEYVMFGGGEQVTVISAADGRRFTSETTRVLHFRDPGPSYDELVAANCCGGLDRQLEWAECQSGFNCGGHWPYLVVFQATHRIRP